MALTARMMCVPVGLLEPNSVLGLSNLPLMPFVKRAYTAFPKTQKVFRPSIVRQLGVPLRDAFSPWP